MKELFEVFKSKRHIAEMCVSALIFFLIAIPFKMLFALMPGVTEIRPANMVPPVLGLLLGPSAAWGISIGNLISDIMGGSSPFVCISGFVTNFFYAYIPYKMWYSIRLGHEEITMPSVNTLSGLLKFIYVVFVDSVVTTSCLMLIFEAAGFQAASSSAVLLFFNNFDFTILLGIPVISLMSNSRLVIQAPEQNKLSGGFKNGGFMDGILYGICAGGVLYVFYSFSQGGILNSSLAKNLYLLFSAGLVLYTLKPMKGLTAENSRNKNVRFSIKAKVTIGFLTLAAVFLIFIGMVAYSALMIGKTMSRFDIWNYIYRVEGIAINIVFAIVVAFLWYVERYVTTPIEILSDLTRKYARQNHGQDENIDGLMDQCRSIRSKDELGALAGSFAKMMEDINNYVKNLAMVTADKERIATELNVATQIQASMLPGIFPAFPERKEFDIFASMEPAKEVGGDFYDFFLVDHDHLGVVIADVSGKGVPAALFMVITKTMIKNHAQAGEAPKDVFTNVNRQLCENNEAGMFVTAWMGIYEMSTGHFTLVNAGHNPPLIKRGDKGFEYLKTRPGFVLAGMEGIQYTQTELQLNQGDILYLYTDGVTEATDSCNELYGEERLLQVLDKSRNLSLKEILHEVKEDIDGFAKGVPQFDDITMLILKISEIESEEE